MRKNTRNGDRRRTMMLDRDCLIEEAPREEEQRIRDIITEVKPVG